MKIGAVRTVKWWFSQPWEYQIPVEMIQKARTNKLKVYSLRRINLFISIFFMPLQFSPTPTHWSYSRWNIFEWFLITPHKYGIQVYHSCVALSKSNAADGLSLRMWLTFRISTPISSLSIRAHVMLSLSSAWRTIRTKPNETIRFDWV